MHQRNWVPATSGNISVRLNPGPGSIAITRSGTHKGFLDASAVIEVDLDGRPTVDGDRPSAETLLHCQIFQAFPDAMAVLHGHSVAGTVLSMQTCGDHLMLTGYELFKAFAGQTRHDTTLRLPILDNDQDIARLSRAVAPHLSAAPLGYYIRGHGAYVWGPDLDAALSRLEALEFLLECELARRSCR